MGIINIIACIALGIAVITADRVRLNVEDADVVSEAIFALEELKKLSDSTIYDTLSLMNILSAVGEDGIFHDNIILEIELSSPHFKSGLPSEVYEVFVMTHKEDSVKSFAIDDFPVMRDSAIEEYTNRNVALKRNKSEESFRRLELEALSVNAGDAGYLHPDHTVGRLLDGYASEMVAAVREGNSKAILPQLTGMQNRALLLLINCHYLLCCNLLSIVACSVGSDLLAN